MVQLSVALGGVQVAMAVVPVVVKLIFAGQLVKTGFTTSLSQGFTCERVTVMAKAQVEKLPLASSALYVTVVVPIGNVQPELWVLITEGVVVQLSVAVGGNQFATASISVVVKLILVGQFEKTGFTISFAQLLVLITVILKEQIATLFLESVAMYETIVSPKGKAEPRRCVPVTKGVKEQLSVTVGKSQVATAVVPVVVRVILAGQLLKTGFTVSVSQGLIKLTFTLKIQVSTLFLASVAV